jgi:hypothetical protein
MQHSIEVRVRGQHGGGVVDVGPYEGGVRRDGLAETCAEVVQHDDLVPGVQQQPAGDAADVAGASGDEQFHDVAPSIGAIPA